MTPPTSPADYLFLLAEPFLQIVGAITLSVLPAWGLVTRLRLDPLTKLSVAVMGSYTLMYLVEFGAYLFSAPQWLPLSLLLASSLASACYAHMRSKKYPEESFPWDGIATWGGLAVWIMGMQSRIVVYGAVYWFGDWYEHYERAVFFLDHLPPETRFLQGYWPLAARGPAFNASAALLMNLFGREFWVYQTVATVLNTFPVLPMALLIRDMARIRQVPALLWSALLFGIAPFAVQQETFTWTKFFAVGFILGGIHLYRLGLTRNKPWLVGLSFGAFATGILAHYMALTFALFFMFHFAYFAFKKGRLRQVVIPGMACSALLATWFFYLIVTFGLQATLAANTTLGEYVKTTPWGYYPWHKAFMGNMITTIIPYSWRHDITGIGQAPRILQFDARVGPQLTPSYSELNRKTEWLADLANNPSSLLGSLGWAGGVGVFITAVLWSRKRRKGSSGLPTESPSDHDPPAPELGWLFWLIFFVLGIPLNVLSIRAYDPLGLAHVHLQPFVCLTAVLLLRRLRDLAVLPKLFLCGIFLIESALTTGALITLQGRQVPLVLQPDGTLLVLEKIGLSVNYVSNYILKLRNNSVLLSDRLGDISGPFSLIAAVIPIGLFIAPLIWSLLSSPKAEEPVAERSD